MLKEGTAWVPLKQPTLVLIMKEVFVQSAAPAGLNQEVAAWIQLDTGEMRSSGVGNVGASAVTPRHPKSRAAPSCRDGAAGGFLSAHLQAWHSHGNS